MKNCLWILSASLIVSGSALAAPKAAPHAAPAPAAKKTFALEGNGGDVEAPQDDSCGLGWEITKKRTFLATTTRGTTNAFVPPSFGMTTGTIGCAQYSFAKREVEAVTFVASNVEELKMDMASGNGEYVAAFARTLGCSDSVSAEFGASMQKNYSELSKAVNGVSLYQGAKSVVRSNSKLLAACPNAA